MAEAVEQRLRLVAYQRRLRWRSAFTDHDKLRTGKMLEATFHRCINSLLGAPGLDEASLLALLGKYAVGDGRVNWMAFVDAVDAEGQNLEKAPDATV